MQDDTVNNLSEEEITGYQWYTVDDSSNETAIANATAHTYTVTANEVGKKILCKAFYKNGSATKNVKTTPTDNVTPQKTAFAVYSADDNSLDFYKRTEVPTAGSTFEGKTATAVYTGIETMTSRPWSGYAPNIKAATVVDEGIQPKSTAQWLQHAKLGGSVRIAHAIPASGPEPPVQNLCRRVRQSSPAQGKPVALVIWSMTILP